MAKDPYFPFYPNDFLTGTALMDSAETGAYIRLLCHSWESDGLPNDPKMLKRLAGCPKSKLQKVLQKFEVFPDEKLRNIKQEAVREKLQKYRKRQAENAAKRWKKGPKQDDSLMPPHMPNSMPESSQPICQTDASKTKTKTKTKDNSYTYINSPTLEEILTKAEMIGLAEWKAKDWWEEMETCGWLTYNGHPIKNWQPALSRVATKWQADGCPESAEKAIGRDRNGFNAKDGKSPTKSANGQIYALRTQKEEILERMTELKRIYTIDTAIGEEWTNDEGKTEYFDLKKNLNKIKQELRDGPK